jgi:heme/copper-type cytochrome/quinol oxidase subunit 2
MLNLRQDLEPYEKVLVILSLLFFWPGLIFFVTWEEPDAPDKSSKLFLIVVVSVILTFYFTLLTSMANDVALEYSRPEAMPAFWRYVYAITELLFRIFGQWLSYAIVFIFIVVSGWLICKLVQRRHNSKAGKELQEENK